jgi:hypothetical protein
MSAGPSRQRLSYDWPALRCAWRHEGRQPLFPGDRDHSLSEEQVAAASKRPLRWRTTPAHAPRSSMIAGTTRSISTRSKGSRFEAARRRISGEESAQTRDVLVRQLYKMSGRDQCNLAHAVFAAACTSTRRLRARCNSSSAHEGCRAGASSTSQPIYARRHRCA